MVTKAYIKGKDGKTIPLLADKPLHWEQTKGITPYQLVLNTSPDFKDDVVEMSKGVCNLVIETDDASLEVKKLYVLDFPVPPNPRYFSFVVSDFRWMWPYFHVMARYNVPRHIGYKRVPAPNLELAEVVEEIFYKKYSLKDPKKEFPENKLKPTEALMYVMDILQKHETDYSGAVRGYSGLDDNVESKLNDIPLVNIEIDDSGDMAVARLIANLPMVNIFIGLNGNINFYNPLDVNDEFMAEKLGPGVFGAGHIRFNKNQNLRPSKVHVLFTKEIECRFDAQDEPENSVDAYWSELGEHEFPPEARASVHFLENVLPVPDFKLICDINPDQAFGGKEVGVELSQGSWITFHQALKAWDDPANGAPWPFMPAATPNLDWGFIRKAMIPFNDIWSGIVAVGERYPDALYAARLASLESNWGRTYRIPNDWIDGSLSIKAYRVSTVDQETGTRAPSMVYADYTMMNTMRNFFKGHQLGQEDSIFWLVDGYPGRADPQGPIVNKFLVHPDFTTEMGIIDADTMASPATFALIDEDQGICNVEWRSDPLRLFDIVIPGHIDEREDRVSTEGQDVVKWARNGSSRGWSWSDAETLMKVPRFTKANKMATILTLIPGGPNSIYQLHDVEVKPDDVRALLPINTLEGLDNANGPEMYVRVGPGYATARIAWKDTPHHAERVRRAFGIVRRDNKNENERDGVGFQFDDQTIINKAGSDPVVIAGEGELLGANLDEVALAVAAKIYAGFTDKMSGAVDSHLNPDVEVAGYVGAVSHSVDSRGGAFTNVQFAESIQEPDIFAFLDGSTRSQIMKLVEPK